MRRRLSHFAPDEVEARTEEKIRGDFGPLFCPPPLRDVASDIFRERHDVEPPSVPVDTSEDAAERIAGRAAHDRARILAHIKSLPSSFGATCREIAVALDLNENTVRPRLWELEGNAPAGKPKLPRLIQKLAGRRAGMRPYCAVELDRSRA
jgi:hypothetical protein